MMRRIPPAQRREELIAAAIRVISRGGVAAATTRAIVAEADMPLGAFSYIFGTQDELMRAVIETVTEQERFAIEAATIDATSMEAAVRSGLNAYLDILVANPEHEVVLFELAMFSRRNGTDGQMSAQWATYYAAAAQMLVVAADLTGSRWTVPVATLSRLMVTMLDGITTTWLADGDTDAARASIDLIATAFATHAQPARDEEHTHAH